MTGETGRELSLGNAPTPITLDGTDSGRCLLRRECRVPSSRETP